MTQHVQRSFHISKNFAKCFVLNSARARGGTVVEALRYKSEGRVFNSRWCHWNFSLT